MDLLLKGKTAVILGGSKGLGRGVADALAAEGVAVALVARGQEALDRAVSEITSRGARAVGFAADLANWPSLEAAANAARKQLGPIDILLNNSGGPPPSGVAGVPANVWEEQFHAMVMPLFRITDLLIGDMRARKWGRILNVASTSVVEPLAAIGVSNTLRSAIVGWAKTLATETARDGITVNTLLPGAITTDRTVQLSRATAERQKISVEEAIQRSAQSIPVGRFGTPAEFGAVAAFLASPLAAYVTGSLIRVDGGALRSV
ncbi:MAG TPA: SDR family oxidoreductase [Candidatus Binatus sp.]|uniref:SDR family oxidoreductase n=1 Tax=Candidatus Binatus sp. TaxID=2811406 RepID=UPI002B468C67|nr:SDR family oxidoreductase [Candidatus Binatus sp.]HKN15029.1 SDR family oxidoreductase [Candidatus Binatus sp.]